MIDASIITLVRLLNQLDCHTIGSCSGCSRDHHLFYGDEGYVLFADTSKLSFLKKSIKDLPINLEIIRFRGNNVIRLAWNTRALEGTRLTTFKLFDILNDEQIDQMIQKWIQLLSGTEMPVCCLSWTCHCGFVLAFPLVEYAENVWKTCPKCGKIWAVNLKIEDITKQEGE